MSKEPVNNWQLKMHKAQALRKEGTTTLFERVKLLCECYADEQFTLWCEDQKTNPEDYLDGEVSDFCSSFLTVKAVYDANRNVDSWHRHGFAYLAHEIAESIKKPASRGVSYKSMYEAAQKEIERLRAEIQTLKESLEIVSGHHVENGTSRKPAVT